MLDYTKLYHLNVAMKKFIFIALLFYSSFAFADITTQGLAKIVEAKQAISLDVSEQFETSWKDVFLSPSSVLVSKLLGNIRGNVQLVGVYSYDRNEIRKVNINRSGRQNVSMKILTYLGVELSFLFALDSSENIINEAGESVLVEKYTVVPSLEVKSKICGASFVEYTPLQSFSMTLRSDSNSINESGEVLKLQSEKLIKFNNYELGLIIFFTLIPLCLACYIYRKDRKPILIFAIILSIFGSFGGLLISYILYLIYVGRKSPLPINFKKQPAKD